MLFFLWHQCLSAPESWPHHRPFIAGAQSIAGTGAKAYWLDLWTGPITNCSDSSPDTTCSWRSLCSVCSCVLEALGWSVSLFTQVTQAGFPPSWHKKHLADLEQLCWCANCCPYLPHECTLWGCLDKSTWKDRCDSSSAVPSKKQESYPGTHWWRKGRWLLWGTLACSSPQTNCKNMPTLDQPNSFN